MSAPEQPADDPGRVEPTGHDHTEPRIEPDGDQAKRRTESGNDRSKPRPDAGPDNAGPLDQSDDNRRRVRRRRRPATPADMPERAPRQTDQPAPDEASAPQSRPTRRREGHVDKAERGLRGLVGAGPTQLSTAAAARARDAARPTADDYAAAEELPIVRRNYVPPSDPPGNSKSTAKR